MAKGQGTDPYDQQPPALTPQAVPPDAMQQTQLPAPPPPPVVDAPSAESGRADTRLASLLAKQRRGLDGQTDIPTLAAILGGMR